MSESSQLLGLSFDAASSPTISLRPWPADEAEDASSGWGFGWYPPEEYAAMVIKDPFSTGDTALSRVMTDWERFRGTLFVCHIRGAAKRVTQQDTHPFTASLGGRHFLLAHKGDLENNYRELLPLADEPLYEPVGRTDSEWMLCWLLTQLRGYGCRRLADLGWPRLHELLKRVNSVGVANVLLSDGQDLVAYRDINGNGSLHVTRRVPPHGDAEISNRAINLRMDDALDRNRTVVLVASSPVGDDFRTMETGELLVARRGAITYTSHPDSQARTFPVPAKALSTLADAGAVSVHPPSPSLSVVGMAQAQSNGQPDAVPSAPSRPATVADAPNGRLMRVTHETEYQYEQPVELSSHVLRLHPVGDQWQDVVEHRIDVTPNRPGREYEDVFGNLTRHMKIDVPYQKISVKATSVVRVRAAPPLASIDRRTSIPLVWMPWQRQMMNPYLLPPELPETQLRELSQFAMSFVERQDYNLVDTIHDINQSIYRDFRYVSGSTTLSTTPFEVYVSRQGVCQDFANLFICLTRLLGVPARYRVGYIHTGANYENKIQSEASHAWAEVYLPMIGWRGFDPTNGCKTGVDHIRIATGRAYQDAAPTQGTIYKGGTGKETLKVNVRVDILDEDS